MLRIRICFVVNSRKQKEKGARLYGNSPHLPIAAEQKSVCCTSRCADGSRQSLEPLWISPQTGENEPFQVAWAQ